MTLLPLSTQTPAALSEALVRRGFDPVRADAAARGVQPLALVLDRLDPTIRDRVAHAASGHGVECLTGDDWALLSAGAARLAGLARPDTTQLPADVAEEIARFVGGRFEPPERWDTARGAVPLDRPVVIGIVNLTPDSFSDGGRYLDAGAALRHAAALIAAGADGLDLGAESTRPGRPQPVSAEGEWRRLEPVLTGVVERFPERLVSVDTVKAVTAARALDAGAWGINDVSGLRLDPEIADVCAAHGAGLVLMHSRGGVSDMASYDQASYRDVTGEVVAELRAAIQLADARGVEASRIVLDPGLGFAKRPEHNYRVLRDVAALSGLGRPIMVGPSRKRFLGAVTGKDVGHRDLATAAACVAALLGGAALFRVHAVAPTREALAVAHAVRSA